MKQLLLSVLACLCFTFAQARNAYIFAYFCDETDGVHLAYSYDGLTWTALNGNHSYMKPMVGKNKYMRDPSVVQGKDGTFYMVWTDSWFSNTIAYASSPDLIHWGEQKTIPVMADYPTCQNCWAPELFYDKPSGYYYIIWSSTVRGLHDPISAEENEKKWNQNQYEATTSPDEIDKAFDPNLNHRIFCTKTKDFQHFTKTKLFFDPDFNVIDAAIVFDPVAKMYIMAVKNENTRPREKNIRITMTKKLSKGFPTEVSDAITPNGVEGPSPLFVGDTLYVYFDGYAGSGYGAVRSFDHGHSWEDVSDKVSFPEGIKHGTAFKVDESVLKNLLDFNNLAHL